MNENIKNVGASVPLIGDRAKEIDWSRIDTGLEFRDRKIILPGEPGEMPYSVAIETIQRIEAAELQTYSVSETVAGLPWDGAVAIFKAMTEIYGVVLPEAMRTWFGKQDPSFLTVKTGPGERDIVQVPCGQFKLPGMDAPLYLGLSREGAVISGTVNKKDRARIVEIAIKARAILKAESIYKGQPIALQVDSDGDLDLSSQPLFFDISGVLESDIIHNKLTADIIQTSIFAPLKHTAACRKHKISLKRGILLEGRYGCGKSLTARVTAKIAKDNGWTFIVLERAQGLEAALNIAKLYEPCVVFAEDIDRFADRDEEKVNDLINLMDGLVPPTAAIMTILTTNHIEDIDKALLRPGRLDSVISIDAPDAETVERLIVHYAGPELKTGESLVKVGEMLAGQIPASIAEIVKRAKLAMLVEDRSLINERDLVTAAESANRQLALLAESQPEPSLGDRLAGTLTEIVGEAWQSSDENATEAVTRFWQEIKALRHAVESM